MSVRTLLCSLGLSLVLGLVGCDGSGGGWAGTVDTLSGGTVRVQNPAEGTWTPETRPRAELDLVIGRAAGAEPYLFGDIRDLTVDAMGRIWVLDTQSREVRVFGPDGSLVRTVGGPGEGPGEFRNPNGLARDPTTGRIWVVDPATSRYSVFDTAGDLVETRPRDATGWGYRWPGRFDRNGRLFDFMLAGGPNARFRGIVVRGDDGAALDTLRFPEPPRPTDFFRIRMENGQSVRPIPFAARPVWEVAPSGAVWWTAGRPYRLLEIAAAGDTLRIIERQQAPVPVTEAELDSIRHSWTEEYGRGVRQVDFGRVPDEKAAIRAVFVARGGGLWVLPYGPQGQTGRIADVFGADGRYRGRLRLPARLRWSVPPVVTDDALYGVREEPATGVDQVVRVGLVR